MRQFPSLYLREIIPTSYSTVCDFTTASQEVYMAFCVKMIYYSAMPRVMMHTADTFISVFHN